MEESSFLNTSQVFTSLALIALVTTPASDLLAAFPFVASCLGCLERIQQHLLRPSYRDQAHHVAAGPDLPEKEAATVAVDTSAARLSNVDIFMEDATRPLLRKVNLDFRPHTFTIILGPSGSGKSMLLRALLGEVRYRGDISVKLNRIAYCPQAPWIFTGTVRQNICGLGTWAADDSWYNAVAYACALDDVFASLPHGDHTYLTGQSCSLSGGQRQRLVLARTLYRRPQLVLLDDVLSALDIRTEKLVMARLFGPAGLISMAEATIILVTHTTRWVSMADNVVTLDGEGNLEQRTNIPCAYSDIAALEMDDDASEPHSVEADVAETVEQDTSPSAAIPSHDNETEDYVFYLKSVRLPAALLLVFFATAQTLCLYMSQVILKWWSSADGGTGETKWLPTYILLAMGNAVLYGCMAWTMFLKLVPESAANLHQILLATVMNAPYAFFTETDVGVILNRFSQDMSLIESQLPTGVMCTLLYVLWTLGSLALISMGSTWMALSIPAVLGAVYILQRVYLRTARRLRALDLELRSPTYNHFLETLKGLSTIRTLHWESQFTDAMLEKLDVSQVPYYILFCAQRWLQLVLDLIVAALAIVVVALAVNLRGYTQSASLGLSLSNILSFNEILAVLLQFWTQLEVSLGAVARTREFADQTPSEPRPHVPTSVPKDWPRHGRVDICNLGADHAKTTGILDDINLTIQHGEKIGVCGRSGSGKSSLLSAILRLLEPARGSIAIDGIPLSCVPHQTIRERLIAVPQDPFLLQGTIRLNLDPSGQQRDEQMIQSLSRVLLWPVLETRGGLDAIVTPDLFSQGQKQLFSLARAILRKMGRTAVCGAAEHEVGGVLLLDEATSNLDATTDMQIQRVIREEFSTYTIITVAHRLDTILDSDQVAVLERGRLVEFGSVPALLSRESAFSMLYAK